jgi:hypothetical protein
MNQVIKLKLPTGHKREFLYCEVCKCYKPLDHFSLVESRSYIEEGLHDYPTSCTACNDLSQRIEAGKAYKRQGYVSEGMSKDVAYEFAQLEKVLETFPLMKPMVMRGIVNEVFDWVDSGDEVGK